MNEDREFLLKAKEQIDQADIQIAKKQGELEAKYKELKAVFKCSSLPAADRKLADLTKTLDKEIAAHEAAVDKIKDAYDWR